MNKLKISATLEDYLELIYEKTQDNKSIKAIDIAKKFDISRPSVTETLQRLEQKGYIEYVRYKSIVLTQKGTDIAKEIKNKHETLKLFFLSVLDLSSDEAEINACKIEHIITKTAFTKIEEYLKNKVI